MNKNLYCVIMAGGVGSRFWPVSRAARPKQFLDLLGTGKSFLRQTYERFAAIVPGGNILVVTGEEYAPLVAEQIPELAPDAILAEPMGRNTAPCIAYAAFRLRAAADPDAVMIVTPADHLITGEEEFRRAIADSVEFARTRDAIMTIGIAPTRPDTGYGYIQVEDRTAPISRVRTFVEKPGADLARVFVDSGEFFWNSGIFIWRTAVVLSALADNMSEMYTLFAASGDDFGTPAEADAIRRIYPATRNVSIDFGMIEKAPNVWVRRSTFGWCDVGTWNSLAENLPHDEAGNTAPANVRLPSTERSIVSVPAGKLAVIRGLSDYIVVDTPDVLLVWPCEREQEIKQVVNTLRFSGGEEFV